MKRSAFVLWVLAIIGAVAIWTPLGAQNPVQIMFGITSWSTAASGIPKVGITDAAGTSFTANSGRLPVLADINNPSASANEAATYATGATGVAEVISFNQIYNAGASGTWGRLAAGQAAMNASLPVTLANNETAHAAWGHGATGAAPPSGATFIAGLQSGATGGFLGGVTTCDLNKAVNISTATTTLMVTGVSGRQVRVCSFHVVTAAANNVAWIEGTGATCGTGTAGMAGGTTAASGYNFAANGGLAIGSGFGEVLATATTGDSVCLVTSAATQLSGFIKYTIY